MTAEWRREGGRLLLVQGGVVWGVVERKAPFWRVRLTGLPGSRLKRAGSLSTAKSLCVDWLIENV